MFIEDLPTRRRFFLQVAVERSIVTLTYQVNPLAKPHNYEVALGQLKELRNEIDQTIQVAEKREERLKTMEQEVAS